MKVKRAWDRETTLFGLKITQGEYDMITGTFYILILMIIIFIIAKYLK